MGAGKTRKKLNTKGSRATGGGGGATAQQIAYTDVTLAQAQAKQAGTAGASWAEGFYRITDIVSGSAGGFFYSQTITSQDGSTIQLDLNGTLFVTQANIISSQGNARIQGKAHLNIELGIIDDFEYTGVQKTGSFYTYQRIRTTDGRDAVDVGNDAFIWAKNSYHNISLVDPTFNFSGVSAEDGQIGIQDVFDSVGDTFTFTADNQHIYGLNEGRGRTISFAATDGLTYTNCIIQSGKTITINSSQIGKYWVDTRSTFTETLDIDVAYNGGTALLSLATVQHAGLIIMNSPTAASPTIKGFSNWLYDGMTRTFQIDGTTNPSFEANPLKFPSVSLVIPPFTLISVNDLAVITYTGTDFLIMADSNNY